MDDFGPMASFQCIIYLYDRPKCRAIPVALHSAPRHSNKDHFAEFSIHVEMDWKYINYIYAFCLQTIGYRRLTE